MIKIENLDFVYQKGMPDERKVLHDINIEIEDHDIVAIIGHTGSGKSTLIQHLNALIRPTSGNITVNGIDITDPKTDLKEVRKKVGMVFQYPEYQLFEETVYKDIAFGPKNMGLSDEKIEKRVYDAMDMVGLSHEMKDRSPFELSGGQKRRVAIAGVLSMNPEILILDEPTAGLDPHGRDSLLRRIENLHKNTGITVIFVSHSMEEVARLAKHVIVMNDGHVYAAGTVSEIFGMGYELQKIGLNIPQVTQLALKLREKGVDIQSDIYTVKYATEILSEMMKRRKK